MKNIDSIYFLTFIIVNWVDIFTTDLRCNLLISPIKFYQKSSDITVYAYVIMPDHMHIIVGCEDAVEFVRSYKSYTTRSIIKYIQGNMVMRSDFKMMLNPYNRDLFPVWQKGNWPVTVKSRKFMLQKVDYIHMNPVKKNLVDKPEEFKYSSARNYFLNDDSVLDVLTVW